MSEEMDLKCKTTENADVPVSTVNLVAPAVKAFSTDVVVEKAENSSIGNEAVKAFKIEENALEKIDDADSTKACKIIKSEQQDSFIHEVPSFKNENISDNSCSTVTANFTCETRKPMIQEINVSSQKSPPKTLKDDDNEGLISLSIEEKMLRIQNDELVLLGDELRRKITSEKLEIDRLKMEINEYQQLYKYKCYSFDSTENSSSGSNDSSASDNEEEEEEDLSYVLDNLIKINKQLEVKNKDISKVIQHEREVCLNIKVQMKMLQTRS